MPIYKNKEFQERIELGGIEIKRVYLGKVLQYGLYELIYHNLDGEYKPKKDLGELSRYAWGKDRVLPPQQGNLDFEDFFSTYRTHFYNWNSDKSCTSKKLKIDKEDHKNFDLCAKWAQKKFAYSGDWHYYTTEHHSGWDIPPNGWAMGGGPDVQEPEDEYGIYQWASSWKGECTWWVDARINKLKGNNRIWNAWSWMHSDFEKTEDTSVWKAGWVACWWSDNWARDSETYADETHVAFIEDENGTCSNGNWGGNRYNVVINSKPSPGHNMILRGFVNPSVQGGWEEEVRHDVTLEETECSNQDSPSAELPTPPGDGHNAGWNSGSPKCKTYHRTCEYDDGYNVLWQNNWQLYANSFSGDWPDDN